MITLEQIKAIVDSGQFHHATVHDLGKLHEGLWVYVKEDNGFNGFKTAGVIFSSDKDSEAAYNLVRHTGVSVGSRGQG